MSESRDPQLPSPAEAREGSTARPDDDALWQWVDQLERYAEAGLHARGFVHELSNVLTALQGNCELALLGERPDEMRRDIDRILELARRVNHRLANFKQYLAPVGEAQPPMRLSAAVEAAETYLSHLLRRVTPAVGEVPTVKKQLDTDAPIAMAGPRLVHLLTTVFHVFLADAGQFRGPLTIEARREGDQVALDFSLEAGAAPRRGDETWTAETSERALDVARKNLVDVGGSLERPAPAQVRLRLPVDKDAERRRRETDPWSFHA